MENDNSGFEQRVREIFEAAAFISDLGIKLQSVGKGRCETTLEIRPKHLQQDGFIHAGVQATMADHTAGGAAGSVLREGQIPLSIEFKINFLRPAVGHSLRCRAHVLKAGKTLIVAEAEVFAVDGTEEKMSSKAMVTLAVVDKRR